jgi:two-component system phosphate regulon sensor histidine kinase PhoR
MRLEASRHNIQADRMHFTNILSNLVDNAIKYSGVRPRVSIRTWNSPEGIFISVSDNGIGISPENQKNVFKNLYRIHTGDVHDAKGFGIGLFYVKRMVEMHGGNVMLRSQPGEGSDFTLYFPFGNNLQSSDQ